MEIAHSGPTGRLMPIEVKIYDDIICHVKGDFPEHVCFGLYCLEYIECTNPKVVERRDKRKDRRLGK